jgi:Sap, sulfolipid-1-addressing protein
MLVEILPLALGSALYPTLLAMVVIILDQPNPRKLLSAYLAGAMLASLTVGFLIVAALNAGNTVGGSDHTVGPGIDFAVALVALVLLFILLTGRDRGLRERRERKRREREAKGGRPWSERVLRRDSLLLAFVVGIALNLPGALYLVALKDIAAADLSTATTVLYVLLYNLIMFQWAEIPLVGYAVAPERTERAIRSLHDWLGDHTRQIAIALCAAAAVYLVLQGLADVA